MPARKSLLRASSQFPEAFWILTRRDLAAAVHHDPFEPEFGDAAPEFARGLVRVVERQAGHADVTVRMEIFGPLLGFEAFATEDEAITRANATIFGLTASIFTKDVDRAQRVARAIEAGTVWTNTWGPQ
jgi:hypothetical protein